MFVTFAVAGAVLLVPGIDRLRRRQRRTTIDEERFHASVQSELRAGSSLRHALAAAARGCPGLVAVRRAALAGRSFDEVAATLLVLPTTGDQARLAVLVTDYSGGAIADVFLRLAERAATAAELDRQRRILTAQTRLSAAIVGGLPLVWLGFGGVGRLQALVDGGGAAIAAAGLVMETMGVAMVWRLAST